jgi:hypothetical protein
MTNASLRARASHGRRKRPQPPIAANWGQSVRPAWGSAFRRANAVHNLP